MFSCRFIYAVLPEAMTKQLALQGQEAFCGDLLPFRGALPDRNHAPNAVGSGCGLRFLFQAAAYTCSVYQSEVILPET